MVKKILFIEDEASLQKAFGEILRKEGYEMTSALNGEIGLKLAQKMAREGKLDLIILDLILPKIDGFEVLKKLKEDEMTKYVPVIILTNLEGLKDVGKALELGATTYLVKANYSLEEVVTKIKQALSVK